MTLVKGVYDQTLDLDDYAPKHLAYLLDRATRRLRQDMADLPGAAEFRRRHAPLTPAFFRLAALIPVGGARVSDLARPAGMTKQALGQLVDVLVTHGYATMARSPDDGRVRIVARTRKGDRLVSDMNGLFERLHDYYRQVLGPRRADQLYNLLEDLATGWDAAAG